MTDKNKQLYLDFEAYERVAEPHKRERASAWRTAIGLQDVDGLKVSDYLKETAVRHIEGDITIDDVREQLKSYYVNKTTHDEDDAEKDEADRVAANIAKLLSEKSFSFTALEFLNIHRHLFEGVFKHAGEVRPYDISKKEWVLQGDSVVYGRAADIMMALRYDIQQEKDFSYKGLSTDEIISHLVDFVTLPIRFVRATQEQRRCLSSNICALSVSRWTTICLPTTLGTSAMPLFVRTIAIRQRV